MVFFYLLRAVKILLTKVCKDVFLYYSNAYCTKKIFTANPLLETILGLSFGIFLYFLRTVWFQMKIWTYILDNTLMLVRLKKFVGGISLFSFLRGGRSVHFQFDKVWYVLWNFAKILLVLLWQSYKK